MFAHSNLLEVCIVIYVCVWNGIYGQILSRHRAVTMSSQLGNWSGERVVDGDYSTNAATDFQNDPWISIDLGDIYTVSRIIVYGSTNGGNTQNLNGLTFKIDGEQRDSKWTTAMPQNVNNLILNEPTPVRNVTVLLSGTNISLELCEFDIFNDKIVSINKTVTMSSKYDGWGNKDGAVDGKTSTAASACQCCAATQSEMSPWLYVDLADFYYINYIIIYGRTDYKGGDQSIEGTAIYLGDTRVKKIPSSLEKLNYYEFDVVNIGPVKNINLTLMDDSTIKRVLVVCEITFYGDRVLSRGKSVTMSQPFDNWVAARAVDGNISTLPDVCFCCAATTSGDTTWLRIDLEEFYYINYIIIEGRTDRTYDGQSFAGMSITLGDTVASAVRQSSTFLNYYQFAVDKMSPVRYVQLTLNRTTTETAQLVVCEIRIYGSDECFDGYYGNCSVRCGHCKDNAPCNKNDETCQGCAAGYTETDKLCNTVCSNGTYGYNCTETCGYCRNGFPCNQTNGACDQCEDGYTETNKTCKTPCPNGTYGNNCSSDCGECRNDEVCNKTDGRCTACKDGYNETDFTCKTACPNGTYGKNCSSDCGECRDEVCNKTGGQCTACKNGYTETDFMCKTECPNGVYGHNCNYSCGNCKDGNACAKPNGTCMGCADGYTETDPLCMTACPEGTFGSDCKNRCGNCKDADSCDRRTGECVHDCKDGYKGSQCLQIRGCPEHEACVSIPAFAGTIAAVVTVMALPLMLQTIYIYRLKLSKIQDEATDRRTPVTPEAINEYESLDMHTIGTEKDYSVLNAP